ncbi:MAG: glutathione S-transferase [Pseudomonadota bacterium]
MGLFSKSKPKVNESLKLICMPGDAASYKCIFLASYRKIPIEIEWGEPSSLDDKMSESLNMSNLTRYPCIKDGDFTVCGESSVLTYLNVKGRTPSIHPRKARVLAMQQYWIQVLNSRCDEKSNYDAVFSELEKAFENQKYIVGEFSLADIHWAAAFKVLEQSGTVIDVSKYKNLSDWIARMKSEIPNYEVENEKAAA